MAQFRKHEFADVSEVNAKLIQPMNEALNCDTAMFTLRLNSSQVKFLKIACSHKKCGYEIWFAYKNIDNKPAHIVFARGVKWSHNHPPPSSQVLPNPLLTTAAEETDLVSEVRLEKQSQLSYMTGTAATQVQR